MRASERTVPRGTDVVDKTFETGKGLSIDDLGAVFDTLGLVGVPDGI